jgi:hypothetical protein
MQNELTVGTTDRSQVIMLEKLSCQGCASRAHDVEGETTYPPEFRCQMVELVRADGPWRGGLDLALGGMRDRVDAERHLRRRPNNVT